MGEYGGRQKAYRKKWRTRPSAVRQIPLFARSLSLDEAATCDAGEADDTGAEQGQAGRLGYVGAGEGEVEVRGDAGDVGSVEAVEGAVAGVREAPEVVGEVEVGVGEDGDPVGGVGLGCEGGDGGVEVEDAEGTAAGGIVGDLAGVAGDAGGREQCADTAGGAGVVEVVGVDADGEAVDEAEGGQDVAGPGDVRDDLG